MKKQLRYYYNGKECNKADIIAAFGAEKLDTCEKKVMCVKNHPEITARVRNDFFTVGYWY